MTQTVLVTGASSGIGKGTALLLQREGFTVFGTTRRPDAVGPQEFPMLPLDVRLDDSVKTCFDSLFSKVDRLDVLIDNAGYALTGAAEETTLAEAKAQFETNFFGAVRVVNAALPTMRAARAGKIIIIGSLAGLTAIPFSAFYSATKFALEGYAEALWHELRPFGISVTLVEPGFVRTRLGEVSQVAAGPLPVYADFEKRALRAIDGAVSRGIAPERVAARVLGIVQSDQPRLRYRVGADATWLPRLKNVAPWRVFAAGVRRSFGLDSNS
ncbi:MAG TPA: SDR family NAD(P)-dependent oxidoreductase [Gemmatimonadales bacterium]|nr:SDR family NAD(P)-dependent oxidoreductase [Gemmatimonadales bacterium]